MNDKQIISDYSIHYLYQTSNSESVKRHIEAYYFNRYKKGLKNIAFKIVKNNFDLDDCLQEAYFIIVKNLKWFDYRKVKYIDAFKFWKYNSLGLKDQIFRNMHNARSFTTVNLDLNTIEYFQNKVMDKDNSHIHIDNSIVDKVYLDEWKSELKPSLKFVIDKLEEGYNLREIGDLVGLTRQRILQRLNQLRRSYKNYEYRAS